MPSARVATAVAVKAGLRRSHRSAYRRSARSVSTECSQPALRTCSRTAVELPGLEERRATCFVAGESAAFVRDGQLFDVVAQFVVDIVIRRARLEECAQAANDRAEQSHHHLLEDHRVHGVGRATLSGTPYGRYILIVKM